jgi:transposase
MYLRCYTRKKNGKRHRYWSIVESRRLAGGRTAQRQVLYLGEINDSQQAAWRKTLEVFDPEQRRSCQLSLFPSDRPIPPDALNAVSVDLGRMAVRRPRRFGDAWLGLVLWRELGLDAFWGRALGPERGAVDWSKVLAVLAINRLCAPASEWAVHRRWFLTSALDDLLGVDFAVAEKDRLYRCLDRLLAHKDALFRFLVERWKTLFDARFDVLLYDLTSTYFEGQCAEIPKARHGYSRDGRPDCRQVVIALVVTPEGFPLAYEVLAGNTSDRTTLAAFLAKIEGMYGKARRVWLMDRGVPKEEDLARMRADGVGYVVGTPRSLLDRMTPGLADRPWEEVHEGMQVKLEARDGELYVLAQSEDRRRKENAMRRRRLKGLVHGLNRLKRTCRDRDRLIGRVAVLRSEAGRAARFVTIRLPRVDEPVTRETFVCTVDRTAWREALGRDGSYILRASIPWEDWPKGLDRQAPTLWAWYMQLVQVEEAFRTLKSDLGLRPIFHRAEPRVEAHILVAFLGYCLSATLRAKLRRSAPGLTAREALAGLGAIQMVDVELPTTDGRVLVLPRHTEPEAEQEMLLEKLGLSLPAQPPPRIRTGPLPEPSADGAGSADDPAVL